MIIIPKARAIDGPCHYTLPPYNHYAKLAPKDPDKVAKKLRDYLKVSEAIVIDANDIGQNVLGKSNRKLNFLNSNKIKKNVRKEKKILVRQRAKIRNTFTAFKEECLKENLL